MNQPVDQIEIKFGQQTVRLVSFLDSIRTGNQTADFGPGKEGFEQMCRRIREIFLDGP